MEHDSLIETAWKRRPTKKKKETFSAGANFPSALTAFMINYPQCLRNSGVNRRAGETGAQEKQEGERHVYL